MVLTEETANVSVSLGILIGVVQCFFGYRIFMVTVMAIGFLLGSALGAYIGYHMSQEGMVAVLIGLLGGVLGIPLMVILHFIAVLFIGAFMGGCFAFILFAVAETEPQPLVVVLAAAIAGGVALLSRKSIIVLSISLGGAWNVVTGIAYFATGTIDPWSNDWLFVADEPFRIVTFLSWIALGIFGVRVQYRGFKQSLMKSGSLSNESEPQPENWEAIRNEMEFLERDKKSRNNE